jgi:Cu+-exporting ATPase
LADVSAPTPLAGDALETTDLNITGMSCAACARRIERQLGRTQGVVAATVNFATSRARVVTSTGDVPTDKVISVVEQTGFGASVITSPADALLAQQLAAQRETKQLTQRLIVAGILTVPLLGIAMAHGSFEALVYKWLQVALSAPVVFWCGWPFIVGAIKAARHRTADMNALVASGATITFAYSLWNLISATLAPDLARHTAMGHASHGPDVYFEAAATIVMFLLGGRLLEARAKGHMGDAIRELLGRQPRTATLVDGDRFIDVPIERIMPESIILVRPGDLIPVDGVITHGETTTDEALLTGESMPVHKTISDNVLGGTINLTGTVRIKATHVGLDTAIAQVVRMVQDAQSEKAPIARIADQVSSWFTPAIFGLAGLVFLLWMLFGTETPRLQAAILHATAILVVACPCALGLATPTAILVGTGRGARMGILIKGAPILELAGRVTTVVLDKTGTITEGHPSVAKVMHYAGNQSENLAFLKAVEELSAHPVASALVAYATSQGATTQTATDFVNTTGLGIQARVAGKTILVGSPAFLKQEGIVTMAATVDCDAWAADGMTTVLLAVDGALSAAFGIADSVKATSVDAIQQLQRLGINIVMLSGDSERTAQAIGRMVGIDRVIAGVRPDGKLSEIRALQAAGEVVCMVGDGINDAPALAQADVGMAIGTGADVAMEASDITLVRGDLQGIVDAILLSRATMSTIRRNLGWAFGYNILMLPLAAGAFQSTLGWSLTPMLASAAMSLSSVSVVVSSLLLRKWPVLGQRG